MAHDPNNIASWPIHEQAKRLWQLEGGHCASSLVAVLSRGYGMIESDRPGASTVAELSALAEQAFELAAPIDDWESAARDAGWHVVDLDPNPTHEDALQEPCLFHEEQDRIWPLNDWRGACEDLNIEPHQREVFEHWIVSDWLADQLAAKGEKVDKDFVGLTIWARTTTGQAAYADHVIEQIAAETYGREG